jgi:uncharacterized repeat protein (TIGR01451 family)
MTDTRRSKFDSLQPGGDVALGGRSHCSDQMRQQFMHYLVILAAALAAVAICSTAVVWAAEPSLLLKETADVQYMPAGPRISYEITLTNQGTLPLTGVVVSDTLPTGAALLYFATPDGGKWSSTQRSTTDGPVALWVNDAPLDPGQSVRLTYVVQLTWKDAPPGRIQKRTAIARAGETESSPVQDIVTALMIDPTPTQLPSPTSAPTLTPALPPPTETATLVPSPVPTLETEKPTLTPNITSSPAQPATLTSVPAAASSAALPDSGAPWLVYIIILIVVVVAVILWLVMKKR